MGRIEDALRRAEDRRDQNRVSRPAGLPEITVEHVSGKACGLRRRFRQHSVMIGRGDHNDVAFDAFDESTVSAHHAELRIEGEQVVLYDMGSLNGCYVGDERVRRALLQDGCEIGLGRNGPRVRLELGCDRVAPAPTDPPMVNAAGRVDPMPPEAAEAEISGGGAFTRLESSIIVGLLVAVLFDTAISFFRLG